MPLKWKKSDPPLNDKKISRDYPLKVNMSPCTEVNSPPKKYSKDRTETNLLSALSSNLMPSLLESLWKS
jgi:hypothetical protein